MMMTTRRSGFTLVELLIVAVLAAAILGVVYETLIVQQRTYAAASTIISDQEATRTALGILESELREIGAIGGTPIGETDLANISAGSITFRAQRKLGIVCTLDRGDNWLLVWNLSDAFADSDKVLIFADDNDQLSSDDVWDTTYVTNASSASNATCATRWPDVPQQVIRVAQSTSGSSLASLNPVLDGAVLRGYEWVTYTLKNSGGNGWTLTRIQGDEAKSLVSGLASDGLQFTYFAADGTATTDPEQVARIGITVRTDDTPEASPVEAAELSTTLHLRNN